MHKDQEKAWLTFEQTGSIDSYLQYRSVAANNSFSAAISTTETNREEKDTAYGTDRNGRHYHP